MVYRKVQNSKYADCYDRIKTIIHTNQGVAISRNRGIKKLEVRLMSKILCKRLRNSEIARKFLIKHIYAI